MIERGVIFLPYLLVSPVASLVTLFMTYQIVFLFNFIDRGRCFLFVNLRGVRVFGSIPSQQVSRQNKTLNRSGF